MKYLISYVQTPTSPVSVSGTTTGTGQIAHRRKNTAGGYSAAVILGSVVFPNTITWQGYNDLGSLGSDEILVRASDSGLWRKVPNLNSQTNTVTVNAIDSAWAAVTSTELADNQAQFTVSNLDFGEFSSASEPAQTVYLLNDGNQAINSLNLDVRGADGATQDTLDERVRVDFQGVLGTVGVGNLDGTSNGSLLFSASTNNSYPITVAPGGVVKLTLNLVNFPSSGLSSSNLLAEFVFTPNRSGFLVPDYVDWQDGGIRITTGYPYQLVEEDPNTTGLVVQPYQVRVGGIIYQTDTPSTISPTVQSTGDVDVLLYVGPNGSVSASEDSLTLPTGSITLASFTWNTTTGALSDYRLVSQPQAERQWVEPSGTLTPGRGVIINSSGEMAHGTPAIGVASTSDGYYVPTGYALVELGSTVSSGQALQSNSLGVYISDSNGPTVALQSGSSGDKVLAFVKNAAASGGGGVPGSETNISIARTPTAVNVESSTGNNGVIDAATVTLAGVMTAADKTKLDGIASGATVTNLGFTRTGTELTVTNSGGADVTLPVATTTQAGLMSAADKQALESGGGGPGPGGSTNLSTTADATTVTVESSTGTDAVLTAATASVSGVMSAADKIKVDSSLVQTGPANVLYLNNWSTYIPGSNAPTRVVRFGDVVTVSGIITGTAVDTPLFRVPVGYRPTSNVVMTFSTFGPGVMLVYVDSATGDCIPLGASGDQLTYTICNGSYIV